MAKTFFLVALSGERTLSAISKKYGGTHAETRLDQSHDLCVDIPKRWVAIHLEMRRSATALLIKDASFHHYLDKLSLLFEVADDLFALAKEALISFF